MMNCVFAPSPWLFVYVDKHFGMIYEIGACLETASYKPLLMTYVQRMIFTPFRPVPFKASDPNMS